MEAVLNRGYKKATYYASPSSVTKVTYQGKRDKRDRQATLIVTTGRPNYAEKKFINWCLKAKEKFPLKKIIVKAAILVALLAGGVSLAQAADRAVTFQLNWQDNSDNETGFRIYKDAGTTPLGSVGTNITAFQHKMTAPEGSNHCFAVTAFNDTGESARSNQACATVPFVTPTAPGGVSVTVSVSVTVNQ